MEQELLQEIASYWGTRAEGYSEVNEKELAGSQREAWLHVLEEQFPEKKKEEMKILDIGTGPGFFPMILSEAGYTVAAVDYTEEMLEKAKENLGKYTKYGLERVTLQRMDAQNLEFADETFDVVISRNLTWNLEKPEQAYQEWMRVLKPGGVLLNFDANWYGYLYDEEKKKRTRQTGRKWKSSSSTTIICARTLTAWKTLRARCRSLRWNGRRGIRRCSNPSASVPSRPIPKSGSASGARKRD